MQPKSTKLIVSVLFALIAIGGALAIDFDSSTSNITSAYPAPPSQTVQQSAYPAPGENNPPSANPSAVQINRAEDRVVTVGMELVNQPYYADISTLPTITPTAVGPGWTELFFEPEPLNGNLCNFSRDRLYGSASYPRNLIEMKWGRASTSGVTVPNISAVSHAVWPAGAGIDQDNPAPSGYSDQLDTTFYCPKFDLSSPRVNSLAIRANMYVDLADPDDYAKVSVWIQTDTGIIEVFSTLIDSSFSYSDWQILEFGPVNLDQFADISKVFVGINFFSDEDVNDNRTGVWVDWIQVKTYREALACGNSNLGEDDYKGLNISSLDPTEDQEDPTTAGTLLIRDGDITSPLNDIDNSQTSWARLLFKIPLVGGYTIIDQELLERYDFMVDSLCDRGISVVGILNDETITIDFEPDSSAYHAAFAGEARRLAQHFGNRITHWEIWNEPDLGPANGMPPYLTPLQYAALLSQSYQEIKAANAGAKIISGGLYNARADGFNYFQAVYDNLRSNSDIAFDHLGLHPYTNGDYHPTENPTGTGTDPLVYMYDITNYNTILDPFLREMALFGLTAADREATIWATEVGWNSASDPVTVNSCRKHEIVSQDQQAEYLWRIFNILRNDAPRWNSTEPGVERIFWYQYMDIPQKNIDGTVCPNESHDTVYGWNFGLRTDKGIRGQNKVAFCNFALHPANCLNLAPRVYMPAIQHNTAGTSGSPPLQPSVFYLPTAPAATGLVDIVAAIKAGSGKNASVEYIEIHNKDSQPIQLQHWSLTNQQGDVYTFPYFRLQPNQRCRIYRDQSVTHWCGFHWEQSGSPTASGNLTLRDGQGDVIDRCRYIPYSRSSHGTHCAAP